MDKKLLPEDITLDNIHTLSGDTLHAIEEQKITQEKLIARREQEEVRIRQEREYRQEQVKTVRSYKVRNILILLSSAVALFGASILVLNFVNNKNQNVPVQPIQTEQTLVSFEIKKEIIFSLADVRDIEKMKTKFLTEAVATSNGNTYYVTDPSIANLFSTLSPSVPDMFLRTVKEIFYGGRANGNFVVINVDSYERSYAGLLEWEPTMSTDLTPLFGVVATSSAPFQDKVIENKDVRSVYDSSGQIMFLYGFYNQNIVIFAKNEEVFKSIFDSLLRQNL